MRGLRVYGNIYRPMFGQVLQSAGCSIDLEILSLPSCAEVTKGDRLYVTPVFVRPLFKGIASHPCQQSTARLGMGILRQDGPRACDGCGSLRQWRELFPLGACLGFL